jgi:beta-ribofuranosylaminobenzene 5'-phosphate synthase
MTVFVEAPARLHFGILDLTGSLGRWFGGIGAAAPAPTLLLSAESSKSLHVEGPDAERARLFAARFCTSFGIPEAASIRIQHALPAHRGLGSGTQLALAVARSLAELHGLEMDVAHLAEAVGRTRRSAVGTWIFDGGGLVVEGGRHTERGSAPLIARLPFPPEWRCVLVIPDVAPTITGEQEQAAFANLPVPDGREAERVAHLVLMGLLPSLAEADLLTFGRTLGAIQETTGRWFAAVQGGTFAVGASERIARRLRELGAHGVGQSSWGPTVYGILENEDCSQRLAGRLREELGAAADVYEGPFRSEGARVWRADEVQA